MNWKTSPPPTEESTESCCRTKRHSITQSRLGRIPGAGCILLRVQRLHVLLAELKVVDLLVLLDAAGRDALGQDDEVLLQTPAEQDLGGRLVVLLCQRDEQGVVAACVAHEWTISLQHDAALLAPVYDVRTWEPGVELDLVLQV